MAGTTEIDLKNTFRSPATKRLRIETIRPTRVERFTIATT